MLKKRGGHLYVHMVLYSHYTDVRGAQSWWAWTAFYTRANQLTIALAGEAYTK